MDKFDAATRSRIMGRNKSSGTKSTERKFRSLLVRSAIRNWKLGHNFGLPGNPDFIFPSLQIAIFIDGCFWHGCSYCRTIPVTNRAFWKAKIQSNRLRDRRVANRLKRIGWKVIRIWEHELRANDDIILSKLMRKGMMKKYS